MEAPSTTQPDRDRIDWASLIARLTACALLWFKNEGCNDRDAVLPGTGTSAIDLAKDTLVAVLVEKKAEWNPDETGGDPFAFLLTVMRRDFLDLVKDGRAYKRTVIIDESRKSSSGTGLTSEKLPDECDPFERADTALLIRKLHLLFEDDEEVKEYVTAWLGEGLSKRAEIAYHLGVSEQEVTNRQRRLIYKLKPLRRLFRASAAHGNKSHG